MSLHTIVQESFAGRLRLRRQVTPGTTTIAPAPTLPAVRISISSMRVLETGLAFGAIAAALLLGYGR